jgi:hypothetical protein
MFNFKKTIILIILITFFSNTARADLDFFSRILLSNKKYEKYIAVRSAVVTEDEVMSFFDSVNLPVEQKKNEDLYRKKLFLIVQCKNVGELRAFGKMRFKVQGKNFLIPVYCAELLGNMENFYNCAIIYIGSGIVSDDDDRLKITYHWENLYTL